MVAVQVRQGTLGSNGRGSGPAGNPGRGWSRLRSGREQCAQMVAVEVRQGTLSADGRGSGQAGNTELRWSPLRSESLQCRSGREHWTWRLGVEG